MGEHRPSPRTGWQTHRRIVYKRYYKDAWAFGQSKTSPQHPVWRSAAEMRHRQSHCGKAFHHTRRRAHRQSGHPYRR